MVGSEIDQKYLGILAQYTQPFHEELSITLFRLLGLSSLLARKLYRARKQRKLDPTRATKSLDLYRHIIWMSKEGFIMVEDIIQNIIGSLISTQFAELRVLVYKLRASFLHIFVLFDCRYQASTLLPASLLGGGNAGPNTEIESHDYLGVTIEAFKKADELAADLLPAIHPLRLSVKLEYSAFTFDCVRDEDVGRKIAKKAIDDAFVCTDSLDDDAFEDATHLVGALGVFAKRNL
ncbi:14-3-3 protein, partial [Ascobolus immersus RN42]